MRETQNWGRNIRLLPILLSAIATFSQAGETVPLHVRIDEAVESGNLVEMAKEAGDAAFLRRIHLDLTGRIPSSEQARAFLADQSPDKREKLIGQLLNSREFVRHMAATFDIWLMERHKDAHVKTKEWRAYLTEAFAENRPYHELVAEILAADGTTEKNRPASRFYLDRLGEPNQLTRDVSRIFFGQDLQCAQCHDHPTITDYLQRDYYGMFAFFNRTYFFQPDKKKPAVLAEKAEGDASFKSVFTSAPGEMRPRLLGSIEINEPDFAPGEEYLVKPDKKDKNLKPVPKYSRRSRIADLVASGKNTAFNRNIANRLWAHMMGRGLVEPFDFHHSANPPVHPELLDLLAAEFVRMNFDIRTFLGELAKTKSYQRSFELPENLEEQGRRIESELTSLEADYQLQRQSLVEASDTLDAAKKAWEEARIALEPAKSELKKATAAHKAAAEAALSAKAETDALRPEFEAAQKTQTLLESALAKLESSPTLSSKLKARVNEAASIVKKLNGPFQAKQKAAENAEAKLPALEEAVAKKRTPFETGAKEVAEKTRQVDQCLQAYQDAKAASKLAGDRLTAAKELAKYSELASGEEPATELLVSTRESLANHWSATFALGVFAPLTPEQLCLSTLQATGHLDRLIAGGNAAFDKKLAAQKNPPKPDPKKKDEKPAPPVTEADRQAEVEAYLETQLAGSINRFVQLFGNQAGQPQGQFFATADQALFLNNDGLVRSWLRPSGTNLAARLSKLESQEELAEELYLSILTRYPSDAETKEVTNYLIARADNKPDAIQELAWALLSSIEFRFKH